MSEENFTQKDLKIVISKYWPGFYNYKITDVFINDEKYPLYQSLEDKNLVEAIVKVNFNQNECSFEFNLSCVYYKFPIFKLGEKGCHVFPCEFKFTFNNPNEELKIYFKTYKEQYLVDYEKNGNNLKAEIKCHFSGYEPMWIDFREYQEKLLGIPVSQQIQQPPQQSQQNQIPPQSQDKNCLLI